MPAKRKYPDELRERAVRMVFEIREQTGVRTGAIARIADQLGVNREAVRSWVRQAEVDGGKRPGTNTADAQRIAERERENARRIGITSSSMSPRSQTPLRERCLIRH
ncbi:transposase [Streptomyces violascens]|uniref:transposase n=1 Tax=Streptomyces violascens TaxID=67381 RepID=UPI003664388E